MVSYVNTTAAVKALTDVVVTSGNAKKIVDQLPKDEKIIFGPDHNLAATSMPLRAARCCCGTADAMCMSASRLRPSLR